MKPAEKRILKPLNPKFNGTINVSLAKRLSKWWRDY